MDDESTRKQRVIDDILKLAPTAVTYDISSSDQGHCGWRLMAVTLADGTDLDEGETFDAIELATEEDLILLRWGAFGDRNNDTDLTIDVRTGAWLREAELR
jgi:hypothetical protein